MQMWQQKEAAQHYLRIADVLIPRRQEILGVIASLTAAFTGERPSILDLACGAGHVTAAILEAKPLACATLLDFSDEMIAIARERFGVNPQISVVKRDLNSGLPDGLGQSTFDAAVSCFALHHIEFENRVHLYSTVRQALKPGSLFINGDRFKGEAPGIADWEFDNFVGFMLSQIRESLKVEKTFDEVKATQLGSDQKLGDKPGTVWQMEQDLRAAGFSGVDCIWKYQNLAIIVGTK